MRVSDSVRCSIHPCTDVHHSGFDVPYIDIDPTRVSIILISECAAANSADNYYVGGAPLFARTTIQAFQDAGADVHSLEDVLDLGVYLTTAVKCSKMNYAIHRDTIVECSRMLEQELNLFPNVRAYLLMGDVAIQAVNAIARRRGMERVIPAGPTYKIRGGEFYFRGARAFPSYLQAGPSFFIEKSKRQMIAEDIAAALVVARPSGFELERASMEAGRGPG
jgi:uracil-DNA glycosylase